MVGSGHFLGGGHPDLREDLPAHLGLIESVDAAESWSILSLGGEVDFHALDVSGSRTYGYDATTGRIMTTTDRATWTTVARGAVVDLAADPADSERLIASGPDRALRLHVLGLSDAALLPGAPRVAFVEWPVDGVLVGVAADERVYLSDDAGGVVGRCRSGAGYAGGVRCHRTGVARGHGPRDLPLRRRRPHLVDGGCRRALTSCPGRVTRPLGHRSAEAAGRPPG